jgi:hypothetical protein
VRIGGREQIGLWQLHRIDPKVPVTSSSPRSSRSWRTVSIRHAGLSDGERPRPAYI